MENFVYRSALELASLIKNGQATSTAIVTEHLQRIKRQNPEIHALVTVFENEALEEAEACDREAKDAKWRGPLHGVPVTVKEQFWIKNKKSNLNAKILEKFTAPEDAVVIERIRKSGAIILGQSNVPKNLIDYQVQGDLYPEGKNPYNLEYTPGGSTGGGAAALAAGFTALELGADFGGSIRLPAAFCGVYGLKPTDKTVPLHGNIPSLPSIKSFIVHMTQAGPLARNIDDLELLWKIIVGPHKSDRNIPDINWKIPSERSINHYKIAWTSGWPGYASSETVKLAIEELVDKLKNNGANIHCKIPDQTLHVETLEMYCDLFPYIISQGTPWYVRSFIKHQLKKGVLNGLQQHSPRLMKAMSDGFKLQANHYGSTLYRRSLLIERWEKFFEEYDFLICPVSFGPAFKRCKIGTAINYEGNDIVYLNYVWPYVACFNASGHPSITIPVGLSKDGLPISVQIVSKYWNEPELITFSKKVTAFTSGFTKPAGY
ncbi:MAG: amidase [Bacteroidota bacterium]